MIRIAEAWRALRMRVHAHSAELRLGLRVSTAAVLSFALSHWLNLPLSLWTVLTAVILTQMNVGRSLKATLDYLVGTLGGAVYSGIVAVLIPHQSEPALLAVLAIGMGPLQSAAYRVIEVALGAVTGLAVSLLVLPARAQGLVLETAGRMLELMARSLPNLFNGLTQELDAPGIRRIHESIGRTFAQLDTVAAEAQREHVTTLVAAPDAGPL